MEVLNNPFHAAVARRRLELNQMFRLAQSTNPSLDPEKFLLFLKTTVEPIVCAAARELTERAEMVTSGLYEVALELHGKKLLGVDAKYNELNVAWSQLLPRLSSLVSLDAANVSSTISNAVYNMSVRKEVRVLEWINQMVLYSTRCRSIGELKNCGVLLAWKSGMAHLREPALEAAQHLPRDLALAAMGVSLQLHDEQFDSMFRRLRLNPWNAPERVLANEVATRIQIVQRSGGFRGFGGQFIRPPVIRAYGQRLFASDGESAWEVFADYYGSSFFKADIEPFTMPLNVSLKDISVTPDGCVEWAGLTAKLNELPGKSIAFDGVTLAATIPTSHQILFMARI